MSGLESISRDETDSELSWIVKELDEAKYNFSEEKRVWQPRPEDILSMFEKLAQGNPLQLKWTCPGRRPPDRNANSEKNTLDGIDMEGTDSKEEELKAPETSAFDFDEPPLAVNSTLVPKRTPGGLGRTPKTEKRVARMDNIMESLKKQQLQRAAERAARKTKGSPSTTPGRSRLLNFGAGHPKHSTTGSGVASSPRFAGHTSTSNTSPLPNRGSMFMTPSASARKMTPTTTVRKLTPNSTTNGTAAQTSADSRGTEAASLYSNTFTSSHQGSSFDFSESRSEQINCAREFAESSTDGQPPSTTASPQITYSSSSSFSNPVTTNSTKASTPGPFMPSVISTSLSMTPNIVSSSTGGSTDKESLITMAESNHQFVSTISRTAASTVISTNTTVTHEAHPTPSIGASLAQAGSSHIGSGVNLENVVPETPSHDQPVSHTESISLSTLNINSDVQHFGSTNSRKPQAS